MLVGRMEECDISKTGTERRGEGGEPVFIPSGCRSRQGLIRRCQGEVWPPLVRMGLSPVVHVLDKKMIVYHGTVGRTGRQPPSPNISVGNIWSWSS